MRQTFDQFSSSGSLYLFLKARTVYDWQEADGAAPPLNLLTIPYTLGYIVARALGKGGGDDEGPRSNRFRASNVHRRWLFAGSVQELTEAVGKFAREHSGQSMSKRMESISLTREVGRLKFILNYQGEKLVNIAEQVDSIEKSNEHLDKKLDTISLLLKQQAVVNGTQTAESLQELDPPSHERSLSRMRRGTSLFDSDVNPDVSSGEEEEEEVAAPEVNSSKLDLLRAHINAAKAMVRAARSGESGDRPAATLAAALASQWDRSKSADTDTSAFPKLMLEQNGARGQKVAGGAPATTTRKALDKAAPPSLQPIGAGAAKKGMTAVSNASAPAEYVLEQQRTLNTMKGQQASSPTKGRPPAISKRLTPPELPIKPQGSTRFAKEKAVLRGMAKEGITTSADRSERAKDKQEQEVAPHRLPTITAMDDAEGQWTELAVNALLTSVSPAPAPSSTKAPTTDPAPVSASSEGPAKASCLSPAPASPHTEAPTSDSPANQATIDRARCSRRDEADTAEGHEESIPLPGTVPQGSPNASFWL